LCEKKQAKKAFLQKNSLFFWVFLMGEQKDKALLKK